MDIIFFVGCLDDFQIRKSGGRLCAPCGGTCSCTERRSGKEFLLSQPTAQGGAVGQSGV